MYIAINNLRLFILFISLSIGCLLTSTALFCQSSTIESNSHTLDLDNPTFLEITESEEESTFLATIYDTNNLTKQIHKKVVFKDKLEDRDFFKVVRLDQQVYILSTSFLSNLKTRVFYYQRLNIPTLILGERKEFGRYFTIEKEANYGIETSQEESKLLLYTPNHFEERGQVSLNIFIYDGQFQQTSAHNYYLPYENKQYEFLQGLIGDNETVYLIAYIHPTKRKKQEQLSLLAIQDDGQYQEITIPLKQVIFNKSSFVLDQYNRLMGIGLEKAKHPTLPVSKKKGLSLIKLGTPLGQLERHFFSFDLPAFQNAFKKGQKKWTQQVVLMDLLVRSDNSFLIEFNHFRSPLENNYQSGFIDEISGMTCDYFVYQEKVFISFKDNQIEWIHLIEAANLSSYYNARIMTRAIQNEELTHRYLQKMSKTKEAKEIFLERKLDRAGNLSVNKIRVRE